MGREIGRDKYMTFIVTEIHVAYIFGRGLSSLGLGTNCETTGAGAKFESI